MIGLVGTVDLHVASTSGKRERQQWGGREGASTVLFDLKSSFIQKSLSCGSSMLVSTFMLSRSCASHLSILYTVEPDYNGQTLGNVGGFVRRHLRLFFF